VNGLTFLTGKGKFDRLPLYAVYGEADFLRVRVLTRLQAWILGDSDPGFAVSSYRGDTDLDFSVIRNELSTLPFLSTCRVVIVEPADDFVTEHRDKLERWLAAPSAVGTLILSVKSLSSNTKLAKALPDEAKIECAPPPKFNIADWAIEWAASEYEKKLGKPAARALIERVGDSMGIVDSELAKLTTYVGKAVGIEVRDIETLIGRSRDANIWRIMDAIGEGKPGEALKVLGELFEEGEEPLKILGGLAFTMRRLAKAGAYVRRGDSLELALDKAGVRGFGQESAKRQIRHLGWNRIGKLYDQMIELDLGLKGGSPLPERMQLERLLVGLGRERPVV